MSPMDDAMREAAKKFWGPLKQGKDFVSGDTKISVASRRQYRTIRLGGGVASRGQYRTIRLGGEGVFVAGYWESSDIKLLQLCAYGRNRPEDRRIANLLFWIVAEARTGRQGQHGMMGPPESITDLVTVEYTPKDGKTWLIGELYDDRVEIKLTWEPEPFRIGDGLHARWMDGRETWLELSAEPTAEYDRVFRRPIEQEEVEEVAVAESKLDKLQAAIDDIEKDIRQLRAKEKDFSSTNIEMARRLGKQNEYEELLKQRDEHMWRENPGKGMPRDFDIVLKLDSVEPVTALVSLGGTDEQSWMYIIVSVRNGKVADMTDFGYETEEDAARAASKPCFSAMGARSQIRAQSRLLGYTLDFNILVKIESYEGDKSSVYVDMPNKTTWLIVTVKDGQVDNDYTDYGYDREGDALRYAKKPVYWSKSGMRPYKAEVREMKTKATPLDRIQAQIDAVEAEIRVLRTKERDFNSSNMEVAERLGKRAEYEELLKQRDEHMWRENPKLPARFNKSILVGATPDQIVRVDLSIGDDYNPPERQSLSFTGTTYNRSVFTAEEGEERAKEYLEDGEIWKDAVANNRTTDSLEAWTENVINMDGWEQVLGDVTQIGDDAFVMGGGGGQIDMSIKSDDFVELAIEKKDARAIWAAWKKYHLKPLSLPEVAGAAAIMRAIFEKYPAFKPEQMLKLTDMAPIEPEVEEETKVAETKIDNIQKQIDAMELQIAGYRKENKDFDSTPVEVAEKLGTRQKFEGLLKQRDELMWRGNPATPFTATWPSEPSHGSPPPPRNMPTAWFDEDGRAILPEHEEEFMDLLVYKFWRGDQVMNEKVMTKGAFMGTHHDDEEYEWAKWDGEYGLSINQYGPTDPSLPAGTLLRTVELNGVEIIYHILAPIKSEGKLRAINRLFVRTHPDLITRGGRPGWFPEEERVPLAIAIDKTHFVIRKMLKQGRAYYPILNWIEIETWTQNGVEPDMKLAAVVGPDGVHMPGYDTLPIPEEPFKFDQVRNDKGIYIELKSPPEPKAGSAGALEHLMFGNELNAELKRIFNVALEVDVAEIPVETTAIAAIQERVDNIEREIRMLRVKEKDFSSSNIAVAARLGKQEEYDKLMRERDEAMWRGNPGERRVITKQDMRKRAKLPKLLYHGTSIQNMHRVLREGLLVHQPQSAYTVESEHQEDTNLNVSLANTIQDAVFFSLGAAGWGANQAIIEFDTTDMPEEKYPAILRRPLFGKTGRFEYKFYTMKGIPPEHISRVLIRSFEKPAGRLEVVEKWYTREEALSLPST